MFRFNRQATGRLDGVDMLRGCAILTVVIYHFWFRFEPAYLLSDAAPRVAPPLWLGVELFFVISGFCIAFTLRRSPDVTRFWARRLARLQPAYMAAALATFAVVGWFGLPDREVGWAALAGNLVWFNAAGLAPHVDGVYWSLVVELKFYLLIGAIWIVARDGRAATLAWAALCLLSLAVFEIDRTAAREALLYPFNVFFLFGLLLYNARALSRLEQAACVAVTLAGVLTAARYAPVAAPTLAMLALAAATIGLRRVPLARPLTYVGLVSFSWYLLHQNIGVVAIRELNRAGFDAVAAPAALVGTFLLAAALHHALELRFRAPLAALLTRALTALRIEPALQAVARRARAAALGVANRPRPAATRAPAS